MNETHLATKTRRTYIVITLLGSLLALSVYALAQSVQETAMRFMSHDLALYSETQQVGRLLSEQERILYEYYATTEPALYTDNYMHNFHQLTSLLTTVSNDGGDSHAIGMVNAYLLSAYDTAKALDENLAADFTDWDLAREQLAEISELRRASLPLLTEIEAEINASVAQGYDNIRDLLSVTVWLVIVFSVGVGGMSIYLGRHAARFILLSSENEKLALFPKRNPNPVIRLDAKGHLLYANPAATPLLGELFENHEAEATLPANWLNNYLKSAKYAGDACSQHTRTIAHRHYLMQSHWIADHQTFDLHLRDITERQEAEDALAFQAYHHPVTNIGNRTFLEKVVNDHLQQQRGFAAIMIDVTDFKVLSENYGLADALLCVYQVGEVLQARTTALANNLSNTIQLFHIADACFMLLVAPDTLATKCIDHLAKQFTQALHTPIGDMRFHLTFGCTVYPAQSADYASIMLHSNIAVESAISVSKQVHYFSNDDGDRHQRRLMITQRLEKAIDDGALTLYFQPKQHLAEGQVKSCESLLRWFDDGTFISPAEFIPIAERSGLILPLGEWVLDQAFDQVRRWHQQGKGIQIAINISPRQFMQPDFVQGIARRLDSYGVPPSLIELELTETSVMETGAAARQVLVALRELGVSLSIDDFGTGYSSLAYLSGFPVDKIKIDRSFVQYMDEQPEQQAIVLTICQLAKNLGLSVIAEGVETEAQRELLASFGCDYIQGYWLAKPMPANEVEQLFVG